jgi:hypothetical protein
MMIDLATLLYVLYGIVAVMVMIVLYHVIFIVVDVRKITRRFEDLTQQVEETILKPLALADQGLAWVMEFLNRKQEHGKHHHKKEPIDLGDDA